MISIIRICFERIAGGLALGIDAWWWGGPASQDILVRNNIFRQTTCRNGWGTGTASIEVAAGNGPADPGKGVAFHGVRIVGNTISDSSRAAVRITNATDVAVEGNRIERPFTNGDPGSAIQLQSVDNARVIDNKITGSPAAKIFAPASNTVIVSGNTIEASADLRVKSDRE